MSANKFLLITQYIEKFYWLYNKFDENKMIQQMCYGIGQIKCALKKILLIFVIIKPQDT